MDKCQPIFGKHWQFTPDRELTWEEWDRFGSLTQILNAMDDLNLSELTIKRTDA